MSNGPAGRRFGNRAAIRSISEVLAAPAGLTADTVRPIRRPRCSPARWGDQFPEPGEAPQGASVGSGPRLAAATLLSRKAIGSARLTPTQP